MRLFGFWPKVRYGVCGEARSEPGVDFIQEVQVQSVGASAEFGNIHCMDR